MMIRADKPASQIKIFIETDGSVHKEIGPVPIESLVFEGGGMRGVAYLGATRALFESGIMARIKRVAGTSAGAITAYVTSLGFQQNDLERLLKSSNIAELMGAENLFSAANLSKLIKCGYFNNGNKILDKIREIGRERMHACLSDFRTMHADDPAKLSALDHLHINPDKITFQNLHHLSMLMPEAGFKDLYIVAAKVPAHRSDSCEAKIFSAQHTPDAEVALAVRASISVPKLLKPVTIDGNTYVDGGCISNFPIYIFNGPAFKPENTSIYQGNNQQNFSTLGIKIDTENEVRDLFHAPEKSRALHAKFKDKMVDQISGLPISHSYKMNHRVAREDYSHRSCQIGDEGIRTTQFNLPPEGVELLIRRGYDDMMVWISNYHNCAIESKKFTSFSSMCENMDLDELEIFCDEIMKHPKDVLRIGGACCDEVAPDEILNYQHLAKKVFKRQAEAHKIIKTSLPILHSTLKKYDIDLVTLFSREEKQHEVNEIMIWIKAAETAIKVILASDKNNAVKKEDVIEVTKLIDRLKLCREDSLHQGSGLFHASWKLKKFTMPGDMYRLNKN